MNGIERCPKLHPLHTADSLFAEMKETARYPDYSRRTGRSTAIALHVISQAINNPHQPIRFEDHHRSAEANHHLGQMIVHYCGMLRLEHMQVSPRDYTLTFERRVKRTEAEFSMPHGVLDDSE